MRRSDQYLRKAFEIRRRRIAEKFPSELKTLADLGWQTKGWREGRSADDDLRDRDVRYLDAKKRGFQLAVEASDDEQEVRVFLDGVLMAAVPYTRDAESAGYPTEEVVRELRDIDRVVTRWVGRRKQQRRGKRRG